jgi:hypothetical protein
VGRTPGVPFFMNQLLERMSEVDLSFPSLDVPPHSFLESACKWNSCKLDYSENLDI